MQYKSNTDRRGLIDVIGHTLNLGLSRFSKGESPEQKEQKNNQAFESSIRSLEDKLQHTGHIELHRTGATDLFIHFAAQTKSVAQLPLNTYTGSISELAKAELNYLFKSKHTTFLQRVRVGEALGYPTVFCEEADAAILNYNWDEFEAKYFVPDSNPRTRKVESGIPPKDQLSAEYINHTMLLDETKRLFGAVYPGEPAIGQRHVTLNLNSAKDAYFLTVRGFPGEFPQVLLSEKNFHDPFDVKQFEEYFYSFFGRKSRESALLMMQY